MSNVTIVDWRTGVPEDSGLEATQSFGCEFFKFWFQAGIIWKVGFWFLLSIGCDGISILNRVNIEKTGIPHLDEQTTDGWEWSSNAGNVLT